MGVWSKKYPANLVPAAWEKREGAVNKALKKNYRITDALKRAYYIFLHWEGRQYVEDDLVARNIKAAMEKGDAFLIEQSLRLCQKKEDYLGELKKALDAVKTQADALAKDIKASALVSRMERAFVEEMAKQCVPLVLEVRREIEKAEAALWQARTELSKKLTSPKAPGKP